MCGINGFNFSDRTRVNLMNEAIRHRGPDSEGVFSDEPVTLGNVRLAIQDLSTSGNQPMTYRHNDRIATITYNGEIYNFAHIRARLSAKGYTFESKSDTEVVVASYIDSGYDSVEAFNGMWGFAIYDPGNHALFCSRDRVGKKPFYYYVDDACFVFSSKLKGILSQDYLHVNRKTNINKEAVNLYFGLGYIPSHYMIYQSVCKLEPRQNLVFNLANREITKWSYYDVPRYEPIKDWKTLVDEGRRLQHQRGMPRYLGFRA